MIVTVDGPSGRESDPLPREVPSQIGSAPSGGPITFGASAPPPSRITYKFSSRRGVPWRPALISLESDRIYIRDDRGLAFCLSDFVVRKLVVSGIIVSFTLVDPLPGYNTKHINLAFGDGDKFMKSFGRGFLSGLDQQQASVGKASQAGDMTSWVAYLRQCYPR